MFYMDLYVPCLVENSLRYGTVMSSISSDFSGIFKVEKTLRNPYSEFVLTCFFLGLGWWG